MPWALRGQRLSWCEGRVAGNPAMSCRGRLPGAGMALPPLWRKHRRSSVRRLRASSSWLCRPTDQTLKPARPSRRSGSARRSHAPGSHHERRTRIGFDETDFAAAVDDRAAEVETSVEVHGDRAIRGDFVAPAKCHQIRIDCAVDATLRVERKTAVGGELDRPDADQGSSCFRRHGRWRGEALRDVGRPRVAYDRNLLSQFTARTGR